MQEEFKDWMYRQVLQMAVIQVKTHTVSQPTFLFGQAEPKTAIFFTYDEDTMVPLPTYTRQRTKTLSQVQLNWTSIDAQGHLHWCSTKQHHIVCLQCNNANVREGRKIDPRDSSNGANLHTCRKV